MSQPAQCYSLCPPSEFTGRGKISIFTGMPGMRADPETAPIEPPDVNPVTRKVVWTKHAKPGSSTFESGGGFPGFLAKGRCRSKAVASSHFCAAKPPSVQTLHDTEIQERCCARVKSAKTLCTGGVRKFNWPALSSNFSDCFLNPLVRNSLPKHR